MSMAAIRLTGTAAFTLLAIAILGSEDLAAQHAMPVLDEMPPADGARLKARTVCSCLFVQELSLQQCLKGDDEIYRYPYGEPPNVPAADERIHVSVVESVTTVELYREDALLAKSYFLNDGGGCVTGDPGLGLQPSGEEASGALPVWRRWPTPGRPLPRAGVSPRVDEAMLDEALREGFSKDGPLDGYTRAVMVVHEGAVVRECYGSGFDGDNRYYLGSTSKIFNNVVAGLLVRQGKLRVNEPVGLPQWQDPDDPRGAITFDHMLRMTSGLQWNEEFFVPGAPGYNVFFGGSWGLDVASYVGARPLEANPGSHYEYSTGASTLLGHALQRKMGARGRADTLSYLHRELLEPIGAVGVVVEFDAAGTMLTGHSIFARPEDMARIGLLLAQDGQWRGKQLLPPDWVGDSTRLDRGESEEPYGAHLMLDYVVPGCFGHTGVGGQKLIVCPAREVVIVWLSSDFDFHEEPIGEEIASLLALQARMIRAFPQPAGE